MAVAYEELAGVPTGPSPLEQVGENFTATRYLKCAWTDRYALLSQELFGLWPYLPVTLARCMGAKVQGWDNCTIDPATGLAVYDKALVELYYTTHSPVYLSKWYVVEEIRGEATYNQMDYRHIYWDDGSGGPGAWGANVNKQIGHWEDTRYEIRGLEYKITFGGLLSFPPAMLALPGCVNNAPFASFYLGLAFDTGTLLYASPAIYRKLLLGVIPRFELTYTFKYRPMGWNTWFNPAGVAGPGWYRRWVKPDIAGGGPAVPLIEHPPANFNLLVP